MELNLPVTLTIVLAIVAIFVFANLRARKPAEPLKVRMVNYHVVQMVCIVLLLVMGAHLITLFAGHAMTGQQPGGRPY